MMQSSPATCHEFMGVDGGTPGLEKYTRSAPSLALGASGAEGISASRTPWARLTAGDVVTPQNTVLQGARHRVGLNT